MLLPTIFVWSIMLFFPCSASPHWRMTNKIPVKESNTDLDFLTSFSQLGKQANTLMEEIGAELGKDKPTSEKYAVLMKQRKKIDELWNYPGNEDKNDAYLIDDNKLYVKFIEKISTPLNAMNGLADQYINQTIDKDTFVEKCRAGDMSPGEILGEIRAMFVDLCDTPVTPSMVEGLAEYRSLIMKILQKFHVHSYDLLDAGENMYYFWWIPEKIHNALDADLDAYKKIYYSYQEAVLDFVNEVEEKLSPGYADMNTKIPKCPMHAHLSQTMLSHMKVKDKYVAKLMYHLLDVSFNTAVCGHAMFNDQPEQLAKYTKSITDEVTFISKYIAQWFYTSLKSAWPTAHQQILNEQILRNNLTSEEVKSCFQSQHGKSCKNFEILNFETHSALMVTGFPNYTYEVVIVNADKNEHEIYQGGDGNVCSVNSGHSGFDTIISRTHHNSGDQNTSGLLKNKREMIFKTRINNTIFFADKNLRTHHSECYAVVREWSLMPSDPCPQIEYVPLLYRDEGSIANATYTNVDDRSHKCQQFQFFFFV